MKRLSFLAAMCVLPILAFAEDKVKHVDAETAAKLVADAKVTVLDVRTADEFKAGHIKDAKNISIAEADFEKQLQAVDKTKPVLVHCQAGGRSTRSLPTLEKLGFTTVYHLDGGMNDWLKAGKPVVK